MQKFVRYVYVLFFVYNYDFVLFFHSQIPVVSFGIFHSHISRYVY